MCACECVGVGGGGGSGYVIHLLCSLASSTGQFPGFQCQEWAWGKLSYCSQVVSDNANEKRYVCTCTCSIITVNSGY